MITHVTDQSFPFEVVLTHPVGDYEVGDKVKVVGFDDEPHTYEVKGGRHASVGGVSPLWFEFTAQDDENEADPTADPVHEAQIASILEAKDLEKQIREDAEEQAEQVRKDQVNADKEEAKAAKRRDSAKRDDEARKYEESVLEQAKAEHDEHVPARVPHKVDPEPTKKESK